MVIGWIALVDQALGEIERGEAAAEAFVAEQGLVHARAAVAERRVEHVLQLAQDVIGVEHRIARHLPQAVGAVAEDVGQARVNMPIWPWKAVMRPKLWP
jgi:hypothetical protein